MNIKKINLKNLLLKITKMDKNSQKNQEIIEKQDDKLKNFLDRLERLSEEKIILILILKKLFLKQNNLGMIQKMIRKILVLRKMDIDERLEQETLLKTYKNALGIY
tara:strand:+ start:434 stop:751 length:318 start_codon:yes stop_codon:yes gene_type:complete